MGVLRLLLLVNSFTYDAGNHPICLFLPRAYKRNNVSNLTIAIVAYSRIKTRQTVSNHNWPAILLPTNHCRSFCGSLWADLFAGSTVLYLLLDMTLLLVRSQVFDFSAIPNQRHYFFIPIFRKRKTKQKFCFFISPFYSTVTNVWIYPNILLGTTIAWFSKVSMTKMKLI